MIHAQILGHLRSACQATGKREPDGGDPEPPRGGSGAADRIPAVPGQPGASAAVLALGPVDPSSSPKERHLHPRWSLCSLVLIAGCHAAPVSRELPIDHPARPEGAPTPFEPDPTPFERTPTYAPPTAAHAAGQHQEAGHGMHAPAAAEDGGAGAAYTCPMHPQVQSDAPGSCPQCGMALRPAAQARAADAEGPRR